MRASSNVTLSRRLFARKGYRVALISRGREYLNKLTKELLRSGEEVRFRSDYLYFLAHVTCTLRQAAAFPIADYSPNSIRSAFASIRTYFPPATSPLRVALFNVGYSARKHFLAITDKDVRYSFDVNVAAFAFSREVIIAFLNLGFEPSSEGGQGGSRKKGTLLFTGTTDSTCTNATTSVFAAEKHALRAFAQSLAKEFGEKNIHVCRFEFDYFFTYQLWFCNRLHTYVTNLSTLSISPLTLHI